jgi:hypothetical protein
LTAAKDLPNVVPPSLVLLVPVITGADVPSQVK